MSRILNVASVAAVGMTVATMLVMAEPGFANDLAAEASLPLAASSSQVPELLQRADLSTDMTVETPKIDEDQPAEPVKAPVSAESLAALVAATPVPDTLDPELRCLAGAVYFEARGESLSGQLAVAHVVINRAESGRFPTSLCGVVHQPSQFSFVRGGKMPAIRESSTLWSNAVAIAQIARSDSWKNQAPGALFFHARHVSPGWRKTRIAQIDNHIFYR
ncbi:MULTISPECIES: cell wall hydrolase [unclassified Sphingopyxis]|uniref:cell wall hydrolase n=1 Tax=unclassified Sphingopyxis TaxID=2614943 RepID=UPI0007374038|nr:MULTISPECIES: cell wall hydrolase [unclassified Sphingopyxis]KTE45727.1 hydrolase [Sphingopyxis sp. HIX]KTE85595.1 hydrolase [Sphingopyxis sp. HXXIV]